MPTYRACNNLDGGRLTGTTSNEMELRRYAWTINYIFVLIGTFLIAIVTTPLVRSLALRVGAVDNPMQDVSIKKAHA